MSSSTSFTELLAFDGLVDCRRSRATRAGPIALQLRGAQRDASGATELLFAGVSDPLPQLPAQLHEARVLQSSAAFRLQAREGHFELRARSVQLHREAAAAFFRAVPPTPVPRTVRLGWGLLLTLLRLPGAARLLR